MKKLILVCCFSGLLNANNTTFHSGYFESLWPRWHSDTCTALVKQANSSFILPANLMCPDNEPNCYEPSSRWDVGIAVLNGPFKALKAYFKYTGKNELTALMGSFNAAGDFVLLCLKKGVSAKEGTIFATRMTRELLRAANGPSINMAASYADFSSIDNHYVQANVFKGLLKIPLLIEKNLDWGDEFTPTSIWLISSMPGISLSLLEHYARYYRKYTLRSLTGVTLTALEAVSFYSLCTKFIESIEESGEEAYKSTRSFLRILLHALQYSYLLKDFELQGASKFRMFTYFKMVEELLVSAMDAIYYNWYLTKSQ